MAVENTSSAYDLSLYETQPKRRVQSDPELQVVSQKSAKRRLSAAFTPKALGSFAIVVTLMSLMVFNHVRLNEITGEISSLKSEITQLESEYTKSASELDSMGSMRVVAERAENELGMSRRDQYHTQYVRLYGEDKINITDTLPQDEGLVANMELAISGLFGTVMEYIG